MKLSNLFRSFAISASLLVSTAAFAQSAPPAADSVAAKQYYNGLPDAAAVDRAQAGANQGDRVDMARLGGTYAFGNGSILPKDPARGVYWLRRAAELGEGGSQIALGVCFTLGIGVPEEDQREAVRWFRKAADAGLEPAVELLSLGLLKGHGPEREPGEAVSLGMNTAAHGVPAHAKEAMHLLGDAYLAGELAPKNASEAMRWYRKAADMGFSASMTTLGLGYFHGIGVPRNEVEGVRWLRLAAEHGDASGMANLGIALWAGRGTVKADREEGIKWLRQAANLGYANAKATLKNIQ